MRNIILYNIICTSYLCEINFSLIMLSYEETCNYEKCRDIFAKDFNVIGEKCNNFSVVTLLTSLKIGCSPTECI